MLKKTLTVILAIQMLLSALALTSCQNTDLPEEGETTTAGIVETVDTEAPSNGFTRLEGEPIELTSDFVIVVPDRNNDATYSLSEKVRTAIATKTGITPGRGFAGTAKEKEIVFGYSDKRQAAIDAYNGINRGEYAVYISGNAVILSAWNNESMSAAADLLLEHSLVNENGKWMLYPYAMKLEDSLPMIADLSAYRIVYPADAGSFLKNTVIPIIREQFNDTFGIMPEAVSDSEPASEYEIVVGNTGRTPDSIRAQLGTEQEPDMFSYVIAAEGSKLYIYANSELALHTAAGELNKYTMPQIGPESFCLREAPQIAGKPSTKDKSELAEGADIRVMSYNILHPSWSNVVENVPIAGRDINLAKILLYYMPDVAGIQEVNSGWHTAIKKILVDTGYYKQACRMTRNGKKTNMTTFLYNPQTVKLIDEYVIDLQSNSDIRVFSVAVFEKLDDGKRFVVTNTHPAPASQNYDEHFAQIMKIGPKEMEKYKDLPVIMTGDFNTSETIGNYKKLMDELGVKDAKYDAETLVRRYNTFMNPGWGGQVKEGDSCIDHIFLNQNAHAKLFNIVIDHKVEKTSDHLPIYADIELK